jgi:hypothetical protein
MHAIILRTFLVAITIVTSLAACHQEQNQAVSPEPQPSKFPQRQSAPEHPPMVEGAIDSLPELMIKAQSEKIKKMQTLEQPVVASTPTPDKRKQLSNVTKDNLALADKIKALEERLRQKEALSQQISKKIESVKNQLNQ